MEVSNTLLVNETNFLYTVPEGKRIYPKLTLVFNLNSNPYFRYKLYYIKDNVEVVIDIFDILNKEITTFNFLCNIPEGSDIYIKRLDYSGRCTLLGELVDI